MDYSDRKIKDVAIYGMSTRIDEEGTSLISGEVQLNLASMSDPEIAGAYVTASLEVEFDNGVPIEEAEATLLNAAHALLIRFAEEPLGAIRDAHAHCRDERGRSRPSFNLRKK